ncbi:MAG: hypothetical protein VYA55_07690 [Pseudomonadota bacterium]|nr:hypothetical protein [Pseudomonadota bacterium]
MDQVLLVAGFTVLGLLGTIHLIYTFLTDKFSPHDATVADAMKSTSPRLTKDTSMWNAWVGFNASHSLGLMLLSATYIPLTLCHFEAVESSLWFSILPVAAGSIYLCLAYRYWFKIPFWGILVALVCFVGSALLIHV